MSIDAFMLASKIDLAILKTNTCNVNIDKLKTGHVKKVVYEKLTTEVNVTDTTIPSPSRLITKIQYDSIPKNKILRKTPKILTKIYLTPSTSGLIKKTDCNTKV